MIAAAAFLLFAAAPLFMGACIGAAMSYEDYRRPRDGYATVACGFAAIVFAFVAGLLI